MRAALAVTTQVVSLLIAGSTAWAQFIDDQTNCSALTRPGLYYFAYPQTGAAPVVSRIADQPLQYQATGRFYFVPESLAQPSAQSDEGVWHIRTQTRAAAAPKADAVYVYRPGVITQCSPGAPLPEFSPNDRFVDINSYIDYHAPNNNGRQPNPGLQRYFHFQIQDATTGTCIRTDDRNVYGNLANLYGFPDVARGETVTAFENTTSVTRPALAASVQYQGLSSEFAYRAGDSARCFAFAAPMPTGVHGGFFYSRYSASLDAARDWHPTRTIIVIKQLRGRRVIEVVNRYIDWTN